MTQIELGKEKYHLNKDMELWCHQNIGFGGWVYSDPNDWDQRHWAMSTMFGNTTFYFKNEIDAVQFSLRWA
jgi:hypothetical protein